MMDFAFSKEENIVGKGENADFQHFFLFPVHVLKSSLLSAVRNLDCVVKI